MCLRIGYFADGPWAHRAFEKIIDDSSLNIEFICVRYSKRDPVLISYGKHYGIPVICESDINSEYFIKRMKRYNVDLFVSMSFNQIFKEEMINLPRLKTINCHAGKLPFYRGRNILNWVLINDEKEFGITVHYVDLGIDTGDIILQREYPITEYDTYATLLERAYVECAEVLYDAIKLLQEGKVKVIKQDSIDRVGLYCGMRTEGDEVLEWNQSSRDIFNFVRAICIPGPQALCFLKGKPLQINKVSLIEGAHEYKGICGQIIGKTSRGFYVKTADTMVEVLEYTYDGKILVGDRLQWRKSK